MTNIKQNELIQMAVLCSKIINGINFIEINHVEQCSRMLLELIGKLERKHPKTELLSSARNAVMGLSINKNAFYIFSRDLIRLANKTFDSKAIVWQKYPDPLPEAPQENRYQRGSASYTNTSCTVKQYILS